MADPLPDIPALVRLPGHQSLNGGIYSHPNLGVAGSLAWGVWKGSQNVRSVPQVKYSRDTAIRDWRDALDVLEQMITTARRQLELLDTPDE